MVASEMNAWQLMVQGGPLMWPILLCSLAGLALFVQKVFYFSSISTDVAQFKTRAFDLIKQNKLKDALVVCEQDGSPVAKVIKAGVVKYGTSRDEIKEAMEGVGIVEIFKLEKHLHALSTIAHVAPLLGLLGTVAGMAASFHAIQLRSASMSPVTSSDVAAGVWQALLTTIFGLFVSIPALLAFNYCVSRVNGFVVDMERAATEAVNLLSHLSESSAPSEVEN